MWSLEGSTTVTRPTAADIRLALHDMVQGKIDAVTMSQDDDVLQSVITSETPERFTVEYHPGANRDTADSAAYYVRESLSRDQVQHIFESTLRNGHPGLNDSGWRPIPGDVPSAPMPAGKTGRVVQVIVLALVALAVVIGGAYTAKASHAPAWTGALTGAVAVGTVAVLAVLAAWMIKRICALGEAVGDALHMPVEVVAARTFHVRPKKPQTRSLWKLLVVHLVVFLAALTMAAVLLGMICLVALGWNYATH